MRQKVLKIVLTFATANDAFAVETAARNEEFSGRMIPVPSEISAGCGLAWCAPIKDKDALLKALQKANLTYDAIHEVWLY